MPKFRIGIPQGNGIKEPEGLMWFTSSITKLILAFAALNFGITNLPGKLFEVSTVVGFREALLEASSNAEANSIHLTAGTYSTQEDGLGSFVYISSTGHKLSIYGESHESTIIDGDNKDTVLKLSQSQVHLENISVTNGYTTGSGGGVKATSAYLTISEVRVSDCHAENGGGGIFANGGISASRSTFYSNNANGSTSHFDSGGAVSASHDASFINCLFEGNKSPGGSPTRNGGAAIYVELGTLSSWVQQCIFVRNTESAYTADVSVHRGQTNVYNSLFINGTTALGSSEANLTVWNSIFTGGYNKLVSGGDSTSISLYNCFIPSSHSFPDNITYLLIDCLISDQSPLFVDMENRDYRLQESSPLKDRGRSTNTNEEPILQEQDYAGLTRSFGTASDIGPFEYWPNNTYNVTISPSPIAGGIVAGGETLAAQGATVSIKATPAPGYRFISWNEPYQSFDSTFELVLNSNVSLVAHFERDLSDEDQDGLTAYDELAIVGTDPLKADTDADGIDDKTEFDNGLDPTHNDSQAFESIIATPSVLGLFSSQEATYLKINGQFEEIEQKPVYMLSISKSSDLETWIVIGSIELNASPSYEPIFFKYKLE
ncbi:InlB B-repeat-containing protein [Pelagicoccus mobilis]|uniref:Bacterial repeat domain-containing protein n=1 Tax=Pelagicoccus mobilis TaxID=415221 RepID=A0A934RX71_9BACT|nr:hypothetical protein [Pelagicoccus mobilis]MBK1877978.1 hypothetical protein [Pelagicoccus mobilis]